MCETVIYRSLMQRRGLTLVELLIAAAATATTLAAAATMVSAVSNAAVETRETRNLKKEGRLLVDRLSAYVRRARGIGRVGTEFIILWDKDANQDDVVNLDEVSILQFDAARHRINRGVPASASSGTSGPEVPYATFTSTSTTALRSMDTFNWNVLANNLVKFAFRGYPDTTETRVVNIAFVIGNDVESLTFRESASPRASADYVFNTKTKVDDGVTGKPLRRKEYSRWTGWADVDGTAVTFP